MRTRDDTGGALRAIVRVLLGNNIQDLEQNLDMVSSEVIKELPEEHRAVTTIPFIQDVRTTTRIVVEELMRLGFLRDDDPPQP